MRAYSRCIPSISGPCPFLYCRLSSESRRPLLSCIWSGKAGPTYTVAPVRVHPLEPCAAPSLGSSRDRHRIDGPFPTVHYSPSNCRSSSGWQLSDLVGPQNCEHYNYIFSSESHLFPYFPWLRYGTCHISLFRATIFVRMMNVLQVKFVQILHPKNANCLPSIYLINRHWCGKLLTSRDNAFVTFWLYDNCAPQLDFR